MTERQYVAVSLNAGRKPYTYHNDREPCLVGDIVKVPLPHGRRMDGEVVEVSETKPTFFTKAIDKIVKRIGPAPEPMRDEPFDFGTAEPVEIKKGRISRQTIRKAMEP